MAKIIASEFITLDGYMVGENEDMSWVIDNFNDELGREMSNHIGSLGGIILGRITYEIMSPYWPNAIPAGNYDEVKPADGTEDPVITDRMNNLPKIIYSKTITSAPWGKYETTVVRKEINSEELKKIKMQEVNDYEVQGSASIVQCLINLNVLDEIRLIVFPVILGKGKKLFDNLNSRDRLHLKDSKILSNGVVILKYQLSNNERI